MSSYFPEPYKDEILYGIISRYHYYSGNNGAKGTIKELFGTETLVPTVEFQSNIKKLCKLINNNNIYNEMNFINYHTNLPIYTPFLKYKRRLEIKQIIINNNGKGLYSKIGIVAGGICVKKRLYYCPVCITEDIKNVGEAYFHRIHQVPGVYVCPTHECLLKEYMVSNKEVGRIKYIRLDTRYVNSNVTYSDKIKINESLIRVARCADYILNNDLSNFNETLIKEKYKLILEDKKLLTPKKRVKQRLLIKLFIQYYPQELLKILESDVDNKESNWIKMITRKLTRSIHPIRHILFILFLCNDAESFFKEGKKDNGVLEEGPWPCLNPAAEHYKLLVINDVKITNDYKSKEPVATFECNCGFIYSRKINEREIDNLHKIGRVKRYGRVWEEKLVQLVNEKKHSLREIGRLMKSEPKTIVKYARRLGVGDVINSSMVILENKPKQRGKDYKDNYLIDIINLINLHPEYTRSRIRKELKKQYTWFYRNDRQCLIKILSASGTSSEKLKTKKNRVNWIKRDIEVCSSIKVIYSSLINAEKPIRITKSIIGFKLGISSFLDYHLDKLTETKKYLSQILETTEDFQIRRVEILCRDMLKKNLDLREWKVLRAAGLNTNCSILVKAKINEYIQKQYSNKIV